MCLQSSNTENVSQVSEVSFVYCILQEQDSCTLVGGFQDKTALVATSPLPLKVLFKEWVKPGGFDLCLFVLGQ